MAYDSTQHLREHLARLDARLAELDELVALDPDLAPLAEEERVQLQTQVKETQDTIASIGAESSETNYTNCIVELRPGAGGDEAKIWMEDLLMMYIRYAEIKKIKVEALDSGVIKLIGDKAYSLFQFESGVHRVQRVPATEAQGRIHTSTASVAVIPEIPETQVEIRDEDLEWQFTRSGGKGGQNVNKVSTAVLLRHIPSGLMVSARQERSQEQNRQIALMLLRSQLWEIEEEKRLQQIGNARSAIGRARRAEKIRTYNYPQNRLTDHRIPQSWHDLDRRLMGDLDDVIQALKKWAAGEDSDQVDATDFSDDE